MALGCERLRVLERGECHVVRSGRTLRTLKAGKGDVLEPLMMCILEGGGEGNNLREGGNKFCFWFDE